MATKQNQKPAKATNAKAGNAKATKAKATKAKRKALSAADALKALPSAISDEWSRKVVASNANRQVRPAKNRASGATIALLDNREGQIKKGDDAPAWYVACMAHGVVVAAPTYRHAKHWRALSSVWCPECKKATSAKRSSAKATSAKATKATNAKPAAKPSNAKAAA
jgi:hypothetical protein